MLTVVHSEQWLGKLTLLARSSPAVDKLAESVFPVTNGRTQLVSRLVNYRLIPVQTAFPSTDSWQT